MSGEPKTHGEKKIALVGKMPATKWVKKQEKGRGSGQHPADH